MINFIKKYTEKINYVFFVYAGLGILYEFIDFIYVCVNNYSSVSIAVGLLTLIVEGIFFALCVYALIKKNERLIKASVGVYVIFQALSFYFNVTSFPYNISSISNSSRGYYSFYCLMSVLRAIVFCGFAVVSYIAYLKRSEKMVKIGTYVGLGSLVVLVGSLIATIIYVANGLRWTNIIYVLINMIFFVFLILVINHPKYLEK